MQQPLTESIRPQFHYFYKSQAIILDSQYNYQGSILAVCNSQGYIYLYSTQTQQSSKQPISSYLNQIKKQMKNNAILKLAWSLPIFGILASCNIYQKITLFKVSNQTKSLIPFKNQISLDSIPISLSFCPIQTQCILTVGLSDGTIKIFNIKIDDEIQMIQNIQAHYQVINCLAWDSSIYNLNKNKWVLNNMQPITTNSKQSSFMKNAYLLSCSSDSSIKLWKYTINSNLEKKLKLIGTIQKAHQKHVRMIDWKNSYFLEEQRIFASCSQDCKVKIWSVKISQDKCTFTVKGSTVLKGPVYKVKYNDIGSLLAVSYCNQQEQKVETKIYKQFNGFLCQQLKIQS